MKKQVVLWRTKSAKESFKLWEIIEQGNFNWENFKEGDLIYIESLTPLSLPNLVVHSVTNDEIYLVAI